MCRARGFSCLCLLGKQFLEPSLQDGRGRERRGTPQAERQEGSGMRGWGQAQRVQGGSSQRAFQWSRRGGDQGEPQL